LSRIEHGRLLVGYRADRVGTAGSSLRRLATPSILRLREKLQEEKTMAKIKHIAIRTADLEKTVAFYKEVFRRRAFNPYEFNPPQLAAGVVHYQ
jgi:hypothetical protein